MATAAEDNAAQGMASCAAATGEGQKSLGLGLVLGFSSNSSDCSQMAAAAAEAVSEDLKELRLEKEGKGDDPEDDGGGGSLQEDGPEEEVASREDGGVKGEGGQEEEEKEEEEVGEKGKGVKVFYPQRPGEPDCSFYLKTGKCAFGRNCKYNHPRRWRSQAQLETDSSDPDPISVDDVKEQEYDASAEKVGKLKCKYYNTPGGCKYGSSCRYSHRQEKNTADGAELNFLGLPVRPGERECPYYMRHGSCKFSTNCRYHHPDPSASSGNNLLSGYNGGGSSHPTVPSTSHLPAPTWAPSRDANDAFPYAHALQPAYVPQMPVPHQAPPPNSGWNGYRPPMNPPYAPGGSASFLPVATPHGSAKTANGHKYQQQKPTAEFPQRPGQPDCPYYLKNGDCKFKLSCKFHHPMKQDPSPSTFLLSPQGLPLRPGQSVCTHYSRYGICKYGPTCIYHHPMEHFPSQTTGQ